MEQFITFLTTQTPLLYLTQSLWRDEAFSVWIAKDSLSDVIARTSGDFNPPLYYLLLNIWMNIFGSSEIALRSLSLVFFGLTIWLVYLFARKLFKSPTWALYTTALTAVNPMLVYFALELRMYSLVVLLTILTTYSLHEKKWLLYIVTGALGMYTQPFFAFVLIAQSIFLLTLKQFTQVLKNGIGITLLFLPWVPILLAQFKSSGPMWMWPIDATLITSVLGNLYIGYEGTPGHLWSLMQILSLLLGVAFVYALTIKKSRDNALLFFCLIFVPLILVLSISLIKPIYVHRYVIFVTVGEIFLLSLALKNMRNQRVAKWLGVSLIVGTVLINFMFAPHHAKVNFQKPFKELNSQIAPTDSIYAETPLVFYESLYYAPPDVRVYLYNPNRINPPRFVGSVGMPETTWATEYPKFPNRAFVIKENGTYEIKSQE